MRECALWVSECVCACVRVLCTVLASIGGLSLEVDNRLWLRFRWNHTIHGDQTVNNLQTSFQIAQGETNEPTQRLKNKRGRLARERSENKKQRSRITTLRHYFFISLFTTTPQQFACFSHCCLSFKIEVVFCNLVLKKSRIKPFIIYNLYFHFLMTFLRLSSKWSRLQQFGSLFVCTDDLLPFQPRFLSFFFMLSSDLIWRLL